MNRYIISGTSKNSNKRFTLGVVMAKDSTSAINQLTKREKALYKLIKARRY